MYLESWVRFFCTTTNSLCKLQTFKVKALHYATHCFLRQQKFEAADVAGKFKQFISSLEVLPQTHKWLQRQRKTLVHQFTSSATN